jgi:predicted Holliday junction resolvase-like endonuclease
MIVPISLFVIAVSFILAFSTLTRNILSFLFNFVFDFVALTWMRFVIVTRLYSIWLSLKSDNQDMRIRRRKKIRQWKEDARIEKQKRKEERQREAEKKEKNRLEMELEKNNQVSRNGNVVRSRTSQMEKGLV